MAIKLISDSNELKTAQKIINQNVNASYNIFWSNNKYI